MPSSSSTMPCPPSRGIFIVLEGIDRCGKTTQSALLQERLADYLRTKTEGEQQEKITSSPAAVAMRFPDRTTAVGQLINQYLQSEKDLDDRAIHLLFSANRWEASDRIVDVLVKQRQSIVCDRYAYSGVAFSASKVVTDEPNSNNKNKDNDEQQQQPHHEQPKPLLSLEWCQAPDRGLPAPDCVIFLDLTQEEAEKRGGFGGERYEKRDMQIRVRQRFSELQAMDSGRVPWNFVNASQLVEDVHNDIWSIVLETLHNVQSSNKPLGKMWQDGSFEDDGECHPEANKENSK